MSMRQLLSSKLRQHNNIIMKLRGTSLTITIRIILPNIISKKLKRHTKHRHHDNQSEMELVVKNSTKSSDLLRTKMPHWQ